MNKLKRCPFCGGEADFERIGTRQQSCIVTCNECGARHESGDTLDSGRSWNLRVVSVEAEGRDERRQEFEQKLVDLVNAYGVTLTAEDGMVGYNSDFGCINLSGSEDGPYWPPQLEKSVKPTE